MFHSLLSKCIFKNKDCKMCKQLQFCRSTVKNPPISCIHVPHASPLTKLHQFTSIFQVLVACAAAGAGFAAGFATAPLNIIFGLDSQYGCAVGKGKNGFPSVTVTVFVSTSGPDVHLLILISHVPRPPRNQRRKKERGVTRVLRGVKPPPKVPT
jgi:hypothetical protein